MEQINLFVELLEANIPSFFRGVHIRKTKLKKPLKQETIDYFDQTKEYKMELEFYLFVPKCYW